MAKQRNVLAETYGADLERAAETAQPCSAINDIVDALGKGDVDRARKISDSLDLSIQPKAEIEQKAAAAKMSTS